MIGYTSAEPLTTKENSKIDIQTSSFQANVAGKGISDEESSTLKDDLKKLREEIKNTSLQITQKINSDIDILKEKVNTKTDSCVQYANFVSTLILIVLAFIAITTVIYYFNLKSLKDDADKDLEKIHKGVERAEELIEEGNKIISFQRSIFRNFEEEANTLFENAGIPEHLIPTEVALSVHEPKKLTPDLEEKLKNIIISALAYKTISLKENSGLATVFIKIGNYFLLFENTCEKAQIFYEYAIKAHKTNYLANNSMGKVLMEQGKYDNALKYFDKAIESNDKYWAAYHNKGWTYDGLKKYDVALEEYEKAEQVARLPSEKETIYYNKACAYSKRNKPEDQKNAYDYLKKSIALEPKNKKVALGDADFDLLFKDTKYSHPAKELCK